MERNEDLQQLCREYLCRVRHVAERFGLGTWVDDIVDANRRNECEGTMEEVEMLSRAVDDERLSREQLPKVLGKSYRKCVSDGDFEKVRKLKRTGIYSKLSALLSKKD